MTNETLLQIQGEITKVTTMANHSLRLQVDTQENLTDEQRSKLMGQIEKLGWFCYIAGEKQIDPWDIAGLPNINYPKDEKSPAQRLRAVLYVLHEQKKPPETFEVFYASMLEKVINQFKEKLT